VRGFQVTLFAAASTQAFGVSSHSAVASFIKLKQPNATLLALGIGLLTLIILSTLWAFRRMPPRQADIESELKVIALKRSFAS